MEKHIKTQEILKHLKDGKYYDELSEFCNDEEINNYCQQYEDWQSDEALCNLGADELAFILYDEVMNDYYENDNWSYDEF